jgi:hypothetical protein
MRPAKTSGAALAHSINKIEKFDATSQSAAGPVDAFPIQFFII